MSNVENIVEHLARRSLASDSSDLPGLVEIQEDLLKLAAALEGGTTATFLVGRCKDAAESIEGIVLREVADTDGAFQKVRKEIGEIQRAVDGAIRTSRSDSGFDPELASAWIVSAESTIGAIEVALLALETGEQDPDTLSELRRNIHTLKGECGVFALSDAQALLHEAESAMEWAIEHKETPPTTALLDVVDWMKAYTKALAADFSSQPPPHSELMNALREVQRAAEKQPEPEKAVASDAALMPTAHLPAESCAEFALEAREHLAAAEAAVLQLEQDPHEREQINIVFRAFHTIKGVAGFMNLTTIVEVAHEAESLLDAARNNSIHLSTELLELILQAADMLGKLISSIEGQAPPSLEAVQALKANLKLALSGKPVPAAAKAPVASPATSKPTETAAGEAPAKAGGRRPDQTVKVSTTRMDALVNLVGELVIAQQMIVQDRAMQQVSDQRLQRNLSAVSKSIRDLQEVSMLLRMVTLKGTFQKMARLVRDVAAKAGKRVTFRTSGEDVELDRNMVDEIADPLVHMIRNSCDHGIEPAEARLQAGKPEHGTIDLRAFHSGGSIVIEIEDDGRGLSREKILKKAIEKGVYRPDRPIEEIPDQEIYNLVFLPGFSTAEKVTDISGRGVGMDVVRRNIEALRGKVEIRTQPGKGTVFSIRLPLTMAIIDGMVVRAGDQRYVLPTLSIEHSFRPTEKEIHTVLGQGEMAMVRGQLLPVYRLHRVLGIEAELQTLTDGLFLVLETNEAKCCLLVDEIIGQQQVVIKNLGLGGKALRGVSGGAILGDGRVALILDVAGIVAEATQSGSSGSGESSTLEAAA